MRAQYDFIVGGVQTIRITFDGEQDDALLGKLLREASSIAQSKDQPLEVKFRLSNS